MVRCNRPNIFTAHPWFSQIEEEYIMFTGIVESMSTITQIRQQGTNKTFVLENAVAAELKVDQSVSHNGICLTVEKVSGHTYELTAIEETLLKTNAGAWVIGQLVNVERCVTLNGRLDGHLVQGHVDGTGHCTEAIEKEGSWEYVIEFDTAFAPLMIEKGSICLNGVSLTAFAVTQKSFRVAIIPYTYHHTTMQYLQAGHTVNLEFDMVGKYIHRFQTLKQQGFA